MGRYLKYLLLLMSILIVSGCTEINEPISSENKGVWNTFIVWPIVGVIQYFFQFTGSYGSSIVVVTVLIRLLVFPLTVKQMKNGRRIQAMQPKIKELQKKYLLKDAATQQKYQHELMQLMKGSNVNPIGGCMPALIQMPVLIGLYHAISRMNATSAFELGSFLGVFLGSPSLILSIMAGAAQLLVLKIASTSNHNLQRVVVQYGLPLMIIGFGLISPAAITLYWIVSSLISVLQNILIYKVLNRNEELSIISK